MIEFKPLVSSSKGNVYIINDGTTRLMLECGLSIKAIRKLTEFKLSTIEGILVTHSHKDHCLGAKDLVRFGIDLWASKETIKELGLSGHRIHIINPKEQFHINTWTILPFDTVHDCEGTLGFLLANQLNERCLFAIDTPYIKYRFKGLHTIAIGCNYDLNILRERKAGGKLHPAMKRRLMQSHMNINTVKKFLQANDLSKVEEIWLLHLSDSHSDEARFKKEIQQLTGKVVKVA